MGKGIRRRLSSTCGQPGHRIGRELSTSKSEAEPNAIGFYEKMGGRYARDGGTQCLGSREPRDGT